jgi:hypothetical protein
VDEEREIVQRAIAGESEALSTLFVREEGRSKLSTWLTRIVECGADEPAKAALPWANFD